MATCRRCPTGQSHWRNPDCWAQWWVSPLSLLASPLIFFFFSLFDTGSHFVTEMPAIHGIPPASVSPVLELQTALAYIFSSV